MSRVAVVIPTFRARATVMDVIGRIGPEVERVFVVDDDCPEQSGQWVLDNCKDARVEVIFHRQNQGVGGAVKSGYQKAIELGFEILVKIDSDGQMDPELILDFIDPIVQGKADYTKGNRFFNLEKLRSMPWIRLIGNASLSLINKFSSGYWNVFDPTNGYTAIHADVAKLLPFEKISDRYFFESDILFRLNTLKAVVCDIPMEAKYQGEVSSLRVRAVLLEFLVKHVRNFAKRIFYNYYLRDMSLASLELPIGLVLLSFGLVFGGYHWALHSAANIPTPAGTVMLAALPVLTGIQLILGFIGYDVSAVPSEPLHTKIRRHS